MLKKVLTDDEILKDLEIEKSEELKVDVEEPTPEEMKEFDKLMSAERARDAAAAAKVDQLRMIIRQELQLMLEANPQIKKWWKRDVDSVVNANLPIK